MAKSKLSDKINSAINVTGNGAKFSLDSFKKSKNLIINTAFKPQAFLNFSPPVQKVTGGKGIALGQINILRGHSDSGKTTALLKTIEACHNYVDANGEAKPILPVIIITEMKWNWKHAISAGLQAEEKVDEETGLIYFDGDFIYVDKSSLETIEDVAAFMNDLLDAQESGKLPRDLCFCWDSIGSIPSAQSVESKKVNNEWDAGAMSAQFGRHINQRIIKSRKADYPYTNTLVAVNKVWVNKPVMYGAQPTLENNCGKKMFFDCAYQYQFGGVTSSGTQKLTATRNGITIEWGKRVKVSLNKNHIDDVSSNGTVIITPYGFIDDTNNEIEKYKKKYGHTWIDTLGGTDNLSFDETESEDE